MIFKTARPAVSTGAPSERGRGYRHRPSNYMLLHAQGEPMIWLTGGALVVALVMIVGLLGMILYQGAGTFWPAPLQAIKTVDGRVMLGEISSSDYDANQELRWKLRGNDEATSGRMERWINGSQILDDAALGGGQTQYPAFIQGRRPEWAAVVDRWQDARVYGVLIGFVEEGKLTADTSAAAHEKYAAEHGPITHEYQLLRGQLNTLQAELPAAAAALKPTVQKLLEQELQSLPESNAQRAALQRAADALAAATGPAVQQSLLTAAAKLPAEKLAVAANSPALTQALTVVQVLARLDQLQRTKLRLQLFSRTSAGQTLDVSLTNIVNLVLPNQLGWWGKLGVYLGRWGEFVSASPRESNLEGGVFPCIWGTVAMTLIMSLLVSPFGVLAALYLREYAKAGAIVSIIRIAINNLAGVPSIVFGAFGLVFFCTWLGGGLDQLLYSPAELSGGAIFGKGGLLWASLTMALLTLPVVIVATEEALAAVPNSMREGSYACGASKWQTIRNIVLPRALPGIMTGLILAMARGAGEVAPLMLVGAMQSAPALPVDAAPPFVHLDRGFMHLSYHIYSVGFTSPDPAAAQPLVMTSALLLIAIITALNILAVRLRNRLRRRYQSNQF